MYLNPDHKEIGKENFHAAVGSRALTANHALVDATVKQELSSGAGLGALYFGYGTVEKPVRVAVLGTGDEGCVLIGAINPAYIDVVAIADIRPYSIWRAFNGDWYSDAARAVRCGLFEKYKDVKNWSSEADARAAVQAYGDYMDLINAVKAGELDIEGVIIALPLHLHAPAAIAAMRAGLHVLTEKLMGHSVAQCKEMARVAKETKRHLATGHQRHYNILYAHAVKLLESGVMGDIHFIRAQWHRGNLPGKDSWQQPLPREAKQDDPQATVLERELRSWSGRLKEAEDRLAALTKRRDDARPEDRARLEGERASFEKFEVIPWRMKVAQKQAQIEDAKIAAERFGYQDASYTDDQGNVYNRPAIEELIRWRLWNRTGGGLMAELGSHQLDAAAIFLAAVNGGKKQHPISVEASAARSLFPLDREVDDHIFCLYEYPVPKEYDPNDPIGKLKRVTVQYASINGNGFDDYGETVYGTRGTLVLERETRPFLYQLADTLGKIKIVTKDGKPDLSVTPDGDEAAAALGCLGTTAMDISRGYTEEEEHWAYCIRENPDVADDGPLPRCTPKIALGDAVIALTTNLSALEDARIVFDEEWFDPDSDKTPELLFVNPNDEEAVKLFTPDVSKYPS